MVKISNRLTTAAALVTQGYTLADVGTDHGYIPIYLLQQEKIPSAIAMDINEGPLERAKEHPAHPSLLQLEQDEDFGAESGDFAGSSRRSINGVR